MVISVKYLYSLLLLLYCYYSFAQNNTDTIHWRPDYKLKWEDFKGRPDTNSIGGAGTSSGFFFHSYYKNDTSLVFIVDCIFFKKHSWVKPSWEDVATLNHEQGHFNVTEVYARKLRLAFKQYKLNKATVIDDAKNIYDSFRRERELMQKVYDKATTYPINNAKQREWDKKIAAWLKKYPAQ